MLYLAGIFINLNYKNMENAITLNVDYQQIATLVAEKIANEPAKEPEKPLIIRGIRGLAAYLEISTSTAQKLKNLEDCPLLDNREQECFRFCCGRTSSKKS